MTEPDPFNCTCGHPGLTYDGPAEDCPTHGRERSPVEVQGDPAMSAEHIEIGTECFANRKRTVVCWQGENYYTAPSGWRFRLVRLLGVAR